MQPGRSDRVIDPFDYGTATVEAVSHPEAVWADRSRTFCLTLSTEPDKPGEPALWSASVDALAEWVCWRLSQGRLAKNTIKGWLSPPWKGCESQSL